MILLTGATGTVGRHLALELKQRNLPFRVLTRDPRRAETILGSLPFSVGDVSRPETVVKALDGIRTAFLLSPADPALASWESSFARAARRAGVERVVKLSAMGAALRSPCEILRWHGEAEEEIQGSGVSSVCLRPAFFYQNFLASADGVRRGAIHAPLGAAKLAMIDARDVAAAAAAALAASTFDGGSLVLTGPDLVGYSDAAAVFSSVLRRPVEYVPVDSQDARRGMLAAGMPPWRADALSQLFTEFREGRSSLVTQTVYRMTGRPALTFEAFVRHHLPSFS